MTILALLSTLTSGFTAEPDRPWSFEPLRVQPLPGIKKYNWPQARLDHFTLARMEAKGLRPAKAAADRVLLRRLYFDLIGLPPTPEQLAAFQKRAVDNRK